MTMDTPETAIRYPLASRAHRAAEAIREETGRVCAERYGRRLRAVIVTGSLARDEATFIEDSSGLQLLGDAEFVLVFEEGTDLPCLEDIENLKRRVEEYLLARHHLRGVLTLSAGHTRYLRNLTPHIFAFELRECGRVVTGEPAILSLIPKFSVSEIPLEDAWRLLANRMIEQLGMVVGPVAGLPGGSSEARYPTLKLYLDMATSFLLFAGAYAPTYRQRAENLTALANREVSADRWPFPLLAFAERVTSSTLLKLAWDQPSAQAELFKDHTRALLDWSEAISYARRLWRWELTLLGHANQDLDDRALMRHWMKAQPAVERLRGWLYVARRMGWWRSWRYWNRWTKHAWRGSPRYWVYAAASELLFGLVDFPRSAAGPTALPVDALKAVLPVAGRGAALDGAAPWNRLGADIVWNYQQFLVETRS